MTRLALALGILVSLSMVWAGANPAPAREHRPPLSGSYRPAETDGPYPVSEWRGEWRDQARDRAIPARIYYPDDAGPFPVIVFSHGLGGSRDGYRYLGQRWASRGYVSVHVQHPGSDSAVLHSWRPFHAMVQAARNPQNALDRPKDISFALDMLLRLNVRAGFPLKGKMDLERVGVGGHSFGAYTALAAAGRVFENTRVGTVDLRDPRIKACVALSAPSKGEADCASYRIFKVPCLHMTGTEDSSPIGATTPAQRRVPFDCIPGPDQYLVTFQGGDHMVFSGRSRQAPRPTDAAFQALVCVATTAFWDAYLKGDTGAEAWLSRGGFKSELGRLGVLEDKRSALSSRALSLRLRW